MDSTVRSTVVVVSIALVVVSSGCIGAPAPNGTSTRSPTDAGTPTTDGTPTKDSTSAADSELVIGGNATWVTTPSRNGGESHGEYITLRYEHRPFGERDPEPLNLSGYTVTYGSGPTYTIPDNVSLGPRSSGDVYIWTGEGENRAYGEWVRGVRSRYVLHAGHETPLVGPDGTTVTVRNRSGGVVARSTVTPINGTVPFVPTVNATEFIGSIGGSVDTIEEAKNATPFALRAPTNVPEGYQFRRLAMGYEVGLHSYTLFYSRDPDNRSDDVTVHVTAPRAVDESDRPGGSHPVEVGDRTGYYATRGTGDDATGHLQFVGPDGWGYFLTGPPGEEGLVRVGESIEVVEGNATG